ncbi:uncharacterized protein LOC134201637 [Bombyx mori]|uniref:uncharacterized protein LOC134201637 n=1 Tax=Bombyx mori TaxID=7091 RepID=UPI002ED44327
MGDFNTNFIAPLSSRSRKLQEIIGSTGLHVLPLQATHHNINGDDTWLDLMLTSTPTSVPTHGQYPAPGFSHHDLIFLSYTIKPPKPQPRVLSMRSFGRMNNENLCKDASKVDWDQLISSPSVDEKVHIFNEVVLGLYNTHAPIRKIKLKRPPGPWMTEGIRMAMRRRDRAFRKFRRNRFDDNWTKFKVSRNRCNQMILNAKRRYILENINSASPADIWKLLGTLGIGRQRHSDFQATISLNDINFHFSSATPLNNQMKCRTLNYLNGLSRLNVDSFEFSSVAVDEIKNIILSIKSNAVGCDNISRRMIVTILDHLLPVIWHITNFSLSSGSFPSLWRKAYVIPLPKIPNPSLPNHFRPISILPFLSKVIEACVHKQLSQFIFRNNLLSPYQSGFRPGHSTVSALLKVVGDIRTGMQDTKVTVLHWNGFHHIFGDASSVLVLMTPLQVGAVSTLACPRAIFPVETDGVTLVKVETTWPCGPPSTGS